MTSAEKRAIGLFVLFHVACLLSAFVVMISGAFVPAFLLLIIAAGLYVPLTIMLGGVADELLPQDQKDEWVRRFRREPGAIVSFWWKYLR